MHFRFNVPLKAALAACLFHFSSTALPAEVKLHALFTDGAVLQREMPLPVWGTAAEGEKVTVSLDGKTATTVAKDGRWLVKLDPLTAGGPHVLTVEGTNKLEVKDVLIGEVWLCGGQSNMHFALKMADNAAQVIPASSNSRIRLFHVPEKWAENEPRREVNTSWKACGPGTVPGFSAIGYFFGRDLEKALDVPVGLINSSLGGTPAQAWTSRAVLEATPAGKGYLDTLESRLKNAAQLDAKYEQQIEEWKKKVALAKAEKKPVPQKPWQPGHRNSQRPACLYDNMIAPLVPFAMRGALWYQGEANAGAPENYRELLPAMIGGWRKDLENPDLAFLLVQLAPYERQTPDRWAWFRETQRQIALGTPNCAMIAIPDLGEAQDIHPKRKEPVGQRLALAAQAITYGKRIEWSGPTLKEAKFAQGKATVTFDHADGLKAKGDTPTGFRIAGEDRKFVPAVAKIAGSTVEVGSPEVAVPVAVRYGWGNMPDGNLWNAAELPASPFRTDDWPRPEEKE